jgi:creatinine amidohydrolase/Fe(II)-dependent formamide hydrolase-like protein
VIVVPVSADLDLQQFGQRVDDRQADAVQSAGDLVAAAVAELAAGVQDRQDDLDGRQLLLGHRRDRNAATVVVHRDGVVGMDRDVDERAVAGERLVDGVVDNLVDEVVQAAHTGRPDVHPGSLANGL